MLIWFKQHADAWSAVCPYGGDREVLLMRSGALGEWEGQLRTRYVNDRGQVVVERGGTFGRGDALPLLKRRAEAILREGRSGWYAVKNGGYCFSADGTLYSCHWHQGSGRFHAGAGIESCPDDSFATLAEGRAYCMKAIGGAS